MKFCIMMVSLATSCMGLYPVHEMVQEIWEEEPFVKPSHQHALDIDWDNWKHSYGKTYKMGFSVNDDEQEEEVRKEIFINNKEKIDAHNRRTVDGKHSHELELNEFADLANHEFQVRNGFKARPLSFTGKPLKGFKFVRPMKQVIQIPESMDWRDHGAVTPVKNQGTCGSCWAFSTTGSLEGIHQRNTGNLVDLSEQNLLDCSFAYGNQGCKGGLMDAGFQYIKNNGGIDLEQFYPYEGGVGQCRYKADFKGATDVGFVDIAPGNEDDLKIAIALQGPISIAIDASHASMQFYRKGVYRDNTCSSVSLNHGVLAVGYGVEVNGDEYWLIKNSWGSTWGEAGYIKMARNDRNMCGVATLASYPLVSNV